MDKKSELDCYLYYVWNVWSKSESIAIFGEWLGAHIWDKYSRYRAESETGAAATLYANVDSDVRAKIVARAVAHYNK